MDVRCEGCAGCCLDWRPLASDPSMHERHGPAPPLDDHYNLVPLYRDDIHSFVESGYADAMRPRLWAADAEQPSMAIDGVEVVAIDDRPIFMVGLRHVPKPVGPFGQSPTWLSTCVFLDPMTLQCRIHDEDAYPTTCGTYPGHHLEMDVESECERVETAWGTQRLLDDQPPTDLPPPAFGKQALGGTVFLHPSPDRLSGVIERLRDTSLTRADRAEFVAVAAAQSPGNPTVNTDRYYELYSTVIDAESWISAAIDDWTTAAPNQDPAPELAAAIEDDRGAPATPGWE